MHVKQKHTGRLKQRAGAPARGEEAGVAVLASEQRHLKTKSLTGNKEGHFVAKRGCMHHKVLTIINVHVPNNRASEYKRQPGTEPRGQGQPPMRTRAHSFGLPVCGRRALCSKLPANQEKTLYAVMRESSQRQRRPLPCYSSQKSRLAVGQ